MYLVLELSIFQAVSSTSNRSASRPPIMMATTTEAAVTPIKNTSEIKGVLAWDTTGWPGDGTAHAGTDYTATSGTLTHWFRDQIARDLTK